MSDLPESRGSAAQSNGFHYDVTPAAKRAMSIYWGPGPLPAGAEAEGIVTRPDGGKGALLRIGRIYVQGNAGALRALPLRTKEGFRLVTMDIPVHLDRFLQEYAAKYHGGDFDAALEEALRLGAQVEADARECGAT